MCNEAGLAAAVMALCAASERASGASGRLFRPWDAAASASAGPQSGEGAGGSGPRKRGRLLGSRRAAGKTESDPPSLPSHGGAASPAPCVLHGHAAALATAADALYAGLSRAELARLGLVCPADLARLRARKQRPKKYRCPHCQVAFSNNGQLRGHIRIHTGERPFACQHAGCGKAFTRNEELTRHRRIHSGVRPYPCPACGKRFGRKDHLKKHARTHQKLAHHAGPAAAFGAAFGAAAVGLFPLAPALLPSLVPLPYPGVFGF